MAEKSRVLFNVRQAGAWSRAIVFGNDLAEITSVVTDSRDAVPGCLFVAIKGERTDGHKYIAQVCEAGAGAVIVAQDWLKVNSGVLDEYENTAFIVGEAPVRLLQDISAGYMRGLSHPVRIGVTGSSGKTTVKEVIAAVLSAGGSVVKTRGNLNSEIGLPVAVLDIEEASDYAVIEMGINRVGEMDILAEIFRPDVVVITNIGTAHIGILGSRENIAAEKKKAAVNFDGSQVLFVSEEETYSNILGEDLNGRLMKYGIKQVKADFSFSDKGLAGWEVGLDAYKAVYPLPGVHNLMNAVCAVCVAEYFGLDSESICRGLALSATLSGRSEIIEGGVTVIQDAYNSNADSLSRSMNFADSVKWNGRKIYVIGDMKELGDNSAEIHEAAGKEAAESCADELFFFGEDSKTAYEAAVSVKNTAGDGNDIVSWTADYAELEEMVLESLQEGDLLLLKASRSMNLERLVKPVIEKFGRK